MAHLYNSLGPYYLYRGLSDLLTSRAGIFVRLKREWYSVGNEY